MLFMRNMRLLATLATIPLLVDVARASAQSDAPTTKTLTGEAAFIDVSQEHPGVRRRD